MPNITTDNLCGFGMRRQCELALSVSGLDGIPDGRSCLWNSDGLDDDLKQDGVNLIALHEGN